MRNLATLRADAASLPYQAQKLRKFAPGRAMARARATVRARARVRAREKEKEKEKEKAGHTVEVEVAGVIWRQDELRAASYVLFIVI